MVPFRTVVFPLTVTLPAAPAVMLCVLNCPCDSTREAGLTSYASSCGAYARAHDVAYPPTIG